MNPPSAGYMNLAAFDSVEAAHRLQAFVERRGFAAQIHDDRKIQRYWFWVPPKAAIQVQVPEPTYETITAEQLAGSSC